MKTLSLNERGYLLVYPIDGNNPKMIKSKELIKDRFKATLTRTEQGYIKTIEPKGPEEWRYYYPDELSVSTEELNNYIKSEIKL